MQTIAEKIKQRRAQMLVHSYVYYRLGENIVSDHKWQEWANELVVLQKEYCLAIGFYDEAFKDWDGSTGYHLPQDDWVSRKANRILNIHNEG